MSTFANSFNMFCDMKEINYKDMKFNPFNLIGGEWMLVTAGNEQKCNTMTASWGHLGCLACPFQLDDYAKFAGELDTIIDTLKNKEK